MYPYRTENTPINIPHGKKKDKLPSKRAPSPYTNGYARLNIFIPFIYLSLIPTPSISFSPIMTFHT